MKTAAAVLPCLSVLVALGAIASAAEGVRPIIDNERVRVWDVTWEKGKPAPIGQRDYDCVTVFLTEGRIRTTMANGTTTTVTRKAGDAFFDPKGSIAAEEGVSETPARAIVIELKDHAVAPLPNHSGYPLAFPRPGIKKVLENGRVITWDYRWQGGVPTPMHFHDKDVAVVYFEDGDLKSTTPDGKAVVNKYAFGMVKFNRRDRIHTELLVNGSEHAVMTELK